jgi:hypothetical protein
MLITSASAICKKKQPDQYYDVHILINEKKEPACSTQTTRIYSSSL